MCGAACFPTTDRKLDTSPRLLAELAAWWNMSRKVAMRPKISDGRDVRAAAVVLLLLLLLALDGSEAMIVVAVAVAVGFNARQMRCSQMIRRGIFEP